MTRARPVVVVLGAPSDAPLPGIEAAGFLDLRFARGADELRAELPGAHALFLWRAERGELESAWDAASDLVWIQSAAAGVDALLFPALRDSEVVLTNARGVYDEAIAEWVVGAMLAFTTGLHRSIVDQQRGVWDGFRHTERLAGRRLTVVGPGPIGRGAGERASALGMTVTMVGRTSRGDAAFGEVLGSDRLHAALADADFVLDALPLTDGTAGMFDAEAFGAMKATARFMNVGRGATVDETALIEALEAGTIAGAALDVFEIEPLPPESLLWSMPGVIVSPHISGDVEGWEPEVMRIFLENAGRWIRGEPLVNLIDKQAGHGVG